MEDNEEYKTGFSLVTSLMNHKKKHEEDLAKLTKEIEDHFNLLTEALARRKSTLLGELNKHISDQKEIQANFTTSIAKGKNLLKTGEDLFTTNDKTAAEQVWKVIQSLGVPIACEIALDLPEDMIPNIANHGAGKQQPQDVRSESPSEEDPPIATKPAEPPAQSSEPIASEGVQQPSSWVVKLQAESEKEGNLEEFKQLVVTATKGELNGMDTSGETALHKAARAGIKSKVALLVQYGANMEATCMLGNTPLHVAAAEGHCSVAESLVRLGANVKATNKQRKTPRECAVESSHARVTEYLAKEEKLCIVQ